MASLSISNPVATMDGIEFTGAGGGVAQKFLVHREGLEDLEHEILETGPEMLKAFDRHKVYIAEVAAKALHDGRGGPGTVVLQSLLIKRGGLVFGAGHPQLRCMNTTPVTPQNLVTLAQLLDRLERSGRPVDAGQFRRIVDRLAAELEAMPHGAQLDAVLAAFPSAAELYENLNYRHAGLCRSPLDAGLAAEAAARAAIDRARKMPASGREARTA